MTITDVLSVDSTLLHAECVGRGRGLGEQVSSSPGRGGWEEMDGRNRPNKEGK